MSQDAHTVRRGLAMAVATAGLVVPLGPVAGASAATPRDGCVRYAELRQVEKGMTRARVERFFGTTRSRFAAGGAGGYSRAYRSCDREHEAIVEYAVLRQGATPRASGFTRWLRT